MKKKYDKMIACYIRTGIDKDRARKKPKNLEELKKRCMEVFKDSKCITIEK